MPNLWAVSNALSAQGLSFRDGDQSELTIAVLSIYMSVKVGNILSDDRF